LQFKGGAGARGGRASDISRYQLQTPEESKYPGDLYKLRATIPAAEAFRPLREGGCPLVSG
jgi:branched-chain amino acid transport system substrate-binding protein